MSTSLERGSLEVLGKLVAGERGLLAEDLVAPMGPETFGPLVAFGPRAQPAPDDYALFVESVFEGYLLHYASPRLFELGDPDLRLLGGDYLYALGLSRLAELGDLDAVAELGDLISLCAKLHAENGALERDDALERAGGLWALQTLAIAAGSWRDQRRSKEALRGGARQDLISMARERARKLDLELELERALIAFKDTVRRNFPTT